MNAPIDEFYFRWLYSQVGSVEEQNPSYTYWEMLRQLYKKEFVYIIENDDNRAHDGLDLRREFLNQEGISEVDSSWMNLCCSMLELLIGLSRRLAFEDGGEPYIWFWHLIENLGLEIYNDNTRIPTHRIDRILDRVISRTYNRKGHGGLFPLNRTSMDQREVELWYQLNEYLIERSFK
jgi:hypothetical protein